MLGVSSVQPRPRRAWLLWVVVLGFVLTGSASAAPPLVRAVDLGDGSMPLVKEVVRVDIDHQHARTVVQRTFHNRTGGQTEGRFAYRAGQGAQVTGFAYWNGEDKIVGEVFEKRVARQVYDQTVSRRADPGLLETDGEGSFSFKVFPIQPDEDKRVELELQQWLARRRGTVEYTLPIQRADADIDIVVHERRGLRKLRSPTHDLDTRSAGSGRTRVKATPRKAGVSQLVLRWEPRDEPEAAGGRVFPLAAFVHRDSGHDAYIVMNVAARPLTDRENVVAKDLTLVIDHSGSMSGEPLERARAAALDVVSRMTSRDRLNVVLFDDSVDLLFDRPRKADAKVRAQALEFIERMVDGGGTDIRLALDRTFRAQHADAQPKNVLFVTDGRSDSQSALSAAENEKADVRVFTLGLGENVERPLLSQLASLKRGKFTFVESAAVLESRVAEVYRQIEAPVLVDLALSTDGARLAQVYPQTLPDLFQGDEVRIAARVRGTGRMKVTLTGRDAKGPVTMTADLTIPASASRKWVGRLWANARIDHLTEKMALRGERKELMDETIELALAYDVVTQYTSFLAIPESELTAQTAQTLAQAREQKATLRAKLADAEALQREEMHAVATDATAVMNPSAAPSSPSASYDMAGADIDMDEDAPELSSRRYSRDESGDSEMAAMKSRRGRGSAAGCASCRTTEAPAPAGLLMLVVLGALRRRRRVHG